jgi:hypothetical protein
MPWYPEIEKALERAKFRVRELKEYVEDTDDLCRSRIVEIREFALGHLPGPPAWGLDLTERERQCAIAELDAVMNTLERQPQHILDYANAVAFEAVYCCGVTLPRRCAVCGLPIKVRGWTSDAHYQCGTFRPHFARFSSTFLTRDESRFVR